MAAGFHVVPSDLIIASGGFTDLQTWASQIHRGIVGSMDDAAGMAGDDDAGHAFGAQYDPVAQAVVNAVGQAVAQLGGTANGLYTMAVNYLRTDADVAAALMQPQELPAQSGPECDQDPVTVQIPSAVGHNTSAVDEIIAQFWPQGDTGKLRQAASDWQQLAQLVNSLGLEGDKQVRTVTAGSSSVAVDSFAANWAKMYVDCATGPLLNSISAAAVKLGAACEAYAQSVDDLCSTLEGLAAGAGVVAGVGIALTVFTLGASDAVAAGGEAAIAGEASAAAVAMAAEVEGSAELAVLAEAEAIVNEAAAGLSPVLTAGAVAVGGTALALAAAPSAMAAGTPVVNTVVPGQPPLPPLANSPFRNLSPADQLLVEQWMDRAKAATDPRREWTANDPLNAASPEDAARRRYQIRVAGSDTYSLYTTLSMNNAQGGEYTMVADGIRPKDGAAIDSKYVGQQPGCKSPLRIGNVDKVFQPVYENILTDQTWEATRYASSFKDPRNEPINHLEVITNDRRAGAYFQAILTAENCPGNIRIEP